jgi:hypothetical protein
MKAPSTSKKEPNGLNQTLASKDNIIVKQVLEQYQSAIQELAYDAKISADLFDLNIENKLVTKIKKTIDNPISVLYDLSISVDKSLAEVVKKFTIDFLKRNKKLIKEVSFKMNSGLCFYIVLEEDNFKNREKLLAFFMKYDLFKLSSKFPVYFFFVNSPFANSIKIELS